ncbi:MAG: DNA polymerase III subunit delta [Candidatus Kuenenia sp.]|nr:DNA polymerase III subunit delta [Candidatus Kuenenia hertensis]
MDIQELKTSIAKNKNCPVSVIFGEEEFFIKEAVTMIKTALIDKNDPNSPVIEMSGNDTPAATIFNELRKRSFFQKSNKLVIVINADSFVEKNKDSLESYLQNPSPYSDLILVCTKWDKRTKLSKLTEKIGRVVDCQKIKDYQLPNWLVARAKYYKKTINLKTAQRLAEDVGNNLAILDMHLEKLAIYNDKKNAIEESDIDALVIADRNRTIFELTDAVAQKNFSQAFKILNQMLIHGENSVKIITLLAWQIRRLWRARQLLAQGKDENAISSELQVVPYFKKRFFEQVKNFTENDLMKKHASLLESDILSKTSTFNKQLLLELLIYKLCA